MECTTEETPAHCSDAVREADSAYCHRLPGWQATGRYAVLQHSPRRRRDTLAVGATAACLYLYISIVRPVPTSILQPSTGIKPGSSYCSRPVTGTISLRLSDSESLQTSVGSRQHASQARLAWPSVYPASPPSDEGQGSQSRAPLRRRPGASGSGVGERQRLDLGEKAGKASYTTLKRPQRDFIVR
jgi:hypothetical protein